MSEAITPEVIVHYSDYASQPDIKLACGRWTVPAWAEDTRALPVGIYLGDEGDLYTFERTDKVNCSECLKYLRAKEAKG